MGRKLVVMGMGAFSILSVYAIMPLVKLIYLLKKYNRINGESMHTFRKVMEIYKHPITAYEMLMDKKYLSLWLIIYGSILAIILIASLISRYSVLTQQGVRYKVADGTHGSAKWMNLKEARRVLDIGSGKGILFGRIQAGILKKEMVTLPIQTKQYSPKSYLNANVAVFGASGSMKSRAFIRNSILQDMNLGRSMVITDPKGEIYQDMAALLNERGYTVKMFNINSRTMKYSDRWNPISEVENDLTAQTFSQVVISNTRPPGSNGDAFWDRGEQNLLKALVLYVINDYPKGKRNLASVYSIIACGETKIIDEIFDELPLQHPAKAPYNIYKQASDNVKSGIVIGLGTRLQVFQNNMVQALTEESDIDLSLPGKEKCAYFCISSDMESTFDFLGSLFYSYLFIRLINYADMNGGRCNVDVDFKLDEFPNIGQIPDFPKKISTMRSRGISAQVIFQNIAQLENRYPNKAWSEILGNCDSSLCLGTTDQL